MTDPLMPTTKRTKLSHDSSIFTEKLQTNDPFMNLPEEVLSLILSKLPLDEAVTTSVLSTKWRHKWKSYPKLQLDGITMCGLRGESNTIQYTQKFIESVNITLQQCTDALVEEFEVKFPYHILLDDHLDDWVSFALSSRTKYLTIDLSLRGARLGDYCHILQFELFDERSLSCLEGIRLVFISLEPLPHFSGFPNLKVLDLDLVYISSKDLDLVLSGCFNLERLSIVSCHKHDGDDDLRVTSPLPRLQYLLVQRSDISIIQLDAKNLTTLHYRGRMIPFDLGENLLLRHVEMHFFPVMKLEEAVTELPRAIPHVENLTLEAPMPLEVLHLREKVSKFYHLKNLELWLSSCWRNGEENILSLASFLRAAPVLQVFDIHFLDIVSPWGHKDLLIRSLPPCHHHHLRQVLVTGFHGGRGQIELVAHIADNSTRLEALVIDPNRRSGFQLVWDPKQHAMDLEMARHNARDYLAGRIAKGVRFDIL